MPKLETIENPTDSPTGLRAAPCSPSRIKSARRAQKAPRGAGGVSKILHLTLHRQWFDLILSGEKTEEYREDKEFWRRRLENQRYDEIHFRNGYARDARWMRVELFDITRGEWGDSPVFVLKLGRILETQNL